jgi:hypothetical protein
MIMNKYLPMIVVLFLTVTFASSSFANASCDLAKKQADKAKKTFIQKVEAADAIGNEYNDCMHRNKDGDQRVCSEIQKKHKKARLDRIEPRKAYYQAAKRQERMCGVSETSSIQ